jgi:N4-gp56 family major capsid protein
VADAFTTTATLDDQVKAAFEQLAYFSLRPELRYSQVADVRPTNVTHNGSSVQFTTYADLSAATTALDESTDISAVAMTDAPTSVTLSEFGAGVLLSAKVRLTSFFSVIQDAMNVVGFNGGQSFDLLAGAPLYGGTNKIFTNGTSDVGIQAGSTLTASHVRKVHAKLSRGNAAKIGTGFVGFIDPDVEYDLKEQSSGNNWYNPHSYSAPEEIFTNEIGMFGGVRWLTTTRTELTVVPDAGSPSGSSLIDVYRTIVVGRQALAEAWNPVEGNGPMPRIVEGPVTDKARRFVPIVWYWFGGFARFRPAALFAIHSSSSLGVNT